MKRLRLAVLLVALALVAAAALHDRRERLPLRGRRELGAGVSVAREASLVVVRVPRRAGVRLRAVLADEAKRRLLPLEVIARGALAAVNGDYHGLEGDARFARTYSPLVTDGASPGPRRAAIRTRASGSMQRERRTSVSPRRTRGSRSARGRTSSPKARSRAPSARRRSSPAG